MSGHRGGAAGATLLLLVNGEGFDFQRLRGREQSGVRPLCRERMGSHTMQTLQDPILLLPWVCFRVAALSGLTALTLAGG
jgi:hypothetical protein